MNKKSIATMLCLLGVAGIYWLAQAGQMEPPGPPASTGYTLEEIYDKADDCRGAGPYEVPKTGQTVSYGFADDGVYQSGVSVNPRFEDRGDGTVKDNLTGLIWLKTPSCLGPKVWTDALAKANELAAPDGNCSLYDGSIATNWRLPNVRELQSLIDYGKYDPAFPESPFGELRIRYWSSTTSTTSAPRSSAWTVVTVSGQIEKKQKSEDVYVWPVREEILP